MPDPGWMYLDAYEIGIRRPDGEIDERVAIAESDLEDARRGPAEHAIEV